MLYARFWNRLRRSEHGAAIIEFALVVPILFMMVWAIISFSRAYQRLNALSASLREGARWASTVDSIPPIPSQVNNIKAVVHNFSTALGYTVDTSQVVVDASTGFDVKVRVVNYPLFSGINFLGGLSSITVSREAVFRLERGGAVP